MRVTDNTAGHPLTGRQRECATLAGLVEGIRGGQSQVLVLRGDAGIGKSALLDFLAGNAEGCRVLRAAGVESEMELAYAGVHQLCAPWLDRTDRLPEPQRDALAAAFGLTGSGPPDRFLIGLAVLNLMADLAEDQPLICLIDDGQWLDRVSAQTVAFVARRLLAERIALVVAVRAHTDAIDFDGLPELAIGGLADTDAGRLLDSVVKAPMDSRVRHRIIEETRGNPLALLELPRAWTAAELFDGFAQPEALPLAGRIDQGFARRIEALPPDTRRLLLIAAAEPLGDAALLWPAASELGLGADPGVAAETAGLIELGARIRFRHPLVRAAAYRLATPEQRREVHRALAEVTDPASDPDRRAWHRAQATAFPDESIAAELEQSASRAQGRGGLLVAAAILERAARLTPEPARRAHRELAAAWVKRDAGALDAALDLLVAVDAGPPDPLRAAEAKHLRGQIAFDQRRSTDAARLLLDAARRHELLDADLARETYLDAVTAAIWASGPDAPDVFKTAAAAARSAPPARTPPRPIDVLLDGLATRSTDGYPAAVPRLRDALATVRVIDDGSADVGRLLSLGGNRLTAIIATELWDFESGRVLAEHQVERARSSGAHVQLQFALNLLASNRLLAGELTAAALLIEEDRVIAEATGNRPVGYSAMLLAALRGAEPAAAALIAASRDEATAQGQGRIVSFADYASAVLYNGLNRHDSARDAALRVFDGDVIGGYQIMAIAELAEASSRTEDPALVGLALARITERAAATSSPWAIGIEARVQALLSEGDTADDLYRASISALSGTGLRTEVARGRLLYGEWLRRAGRRVVARDQLREAYEALAATGLTAFAERARRELVATGEKVRKRAVESADDLTPQEFQIARLARDGLSNPEIGARLFLSPRTVEWHLRKVFTKLGVTSRRQLRNAPLELAPV